MKGPGVKEKHELFDIYKEFPHLLRKAKIPIEKEETGKWEEAKIGKYMSLVLEKVGGPG